MCLQDVEASPAVTMDRIRDLANYKNMVPKVKSVEVYHEETFPNGTVKQWANFQVGLSLLTFSYYLKLAFEPTFHTLTWTLDYSRTSDFGE